METGTVITICDGDLDLHNGLNEAAARFCFADAVADYTTVMDSGGRFYRAESEGDSAWFVLDESREPDPNFLSEQLWQWINRTSDALDNEPADPGSADVPMLIDAIRNRQSTAAVPTLRGEIRKVFRR